MPDHELFRCIGSGSYGEVWLARNITGQYRAVKMVYRDRIKNEREYDREFAGITRFEPLSRTHDGFVDILQVGRNDPARCFYYVMELADDLLTCTNPNAPTSRETPAPAFDPAAYEARTLSAILASHGRLLVADCIRLGLALTAALGHLHRHNLVHRDIKPSNIVFVDSQPKLADVGLVAETSEAHSQVGTTGFIPPEGPGSVQADLYALGKVLYAASTLHGATAWPNPQTGLENLPDQKDWLELNEVINKACDPDPKRRYATAAEMHAELAQLQDGKSLRRLRLQGKRLKQAGWALAGTVVIGLAGLFIQQTLLKAERAQARADQVKLEAQVERQLDRVRAAKRQTLVLKIENEIRPPHTEGWSDRAWLMASNAVRFRIDTNLQSQAAASLAGLDAKRRYDTNGIGGSSVAFDPGGDRVLFGSLPDRAGQPGEAHLLDWVTTNLTAFPVPGVGPVAFLPDRTPVQFSADTNNRLALWRVGQASQPAGSGDFPVALRFFDLADGEQFTSLGALAMTSNGTSVATCGTTIRQRTLCAVWDGASGRLLQILTNTLVAPRTPSASSEGRNMVSEDGNTIGASFPTNVLAFTPDGSLLAAGNDEGEVMVWRTIGGSALPKITAGRLPIRSLAFCRDYVRDPLHPAPEPQWLLAIGDSGGGVTIWEVPVQRLRTPCRGAEYGVSALAFNPDGSLLASAGRHPTKLWDTATGRAMLTIENGDMFTGVAFSSDGSEVAFCSKRAFMSAQLNVWELENGRGVQNLRGLAHQVTRLCCSSNGQLVAAVSHDWQVGLWSVARNRLLHVFNVPPGTFEADNAGLAFSHDSTQFAFMAGTNAMLLDVESGRRVQSWQLPPGYVDRLAFSSSNHLLAFHVEPTNAESRVFTQPTVPRIRDLTAKPVHEVLMTLSDFDWGVIDAWYGPDASFIAVDGLASSAQPTNRVVQVVRPWENRVLWTESVFVRLTASSMRVDLAGAVVPITLVESEPQQLRDPRTGKQLRVSHTTFQVFHSSAGLALLSGESSWHLHSLSNGRPLLQVLSSGAKVTQWPIFSRDGRRVAVGWEDGTVSVCDLEKVRLRLDQAKLGW